MARSKQQGRKKKQEKKDQALMAAAAAGTADNSGNGEQDRQRSGYDDIIMENEKFERFYKAQNIVPPEEWDAFMGALRTPLPVTFRVTGFKSQAESLLDIIKSKYFSELADVEVDGVRQDPPECISWYPGGLAWQINLHRTAIRKVPALKRLHEFLISETGCGNISRQEAVSMIPPLFMDIKPHHKILDMCAAPGSKTAQIIEYLHQDENISIPEGFVIANDVDNKRCYMMVHQVKRLLSPCFMIINHDASQLPALKYGQDIVQFDRVLADVPCSGDATLRKNKDVWIKWRASNGAQLHKMQKSILKRGLELLKDGGRLVYSTCSFHPIENEAVVASMLAACGGSVELVDAASTIPGLKTTPGLTTWKIMDNDGTVYGSFDDVPKYMKKCYPASAFPPTGSESLHLERCMRVLPHHQNTGGFFIAVLTKKKHLPWQKARSQIGDTCSAESNDPEDGGGEGSKGAEGNDPKVGEKRRQQDDQKPAKKRRGFGHKEDPFIWLNSDDPLWPPIKDFYGVAEDFPLTQCLVRCETGKKRQIYFSSDSIRKIHLCNEHKLKVINLGIVVLCRSDNPQVKCDYRLTQDAIHMFAPFLSKRRLKISMANIITLLSEEAPFFFKFTDAFSKELELLSQGSLILSYEPEDTPGAPKCKLMLIGWRGKTSLRSFVPKHERSHYLRLCGVDIKEKESEDSKEGASGSGSADALGEEAGSIEDEAPELDEVAPPAIEEME